MNLSVRYGELFSLFENKYLHKVEILSIGDTSNNYYYTSVICVNCKNKFFLDLRIDKMADFELLCDKIYYRIEGYDRNMINFTCNELIIKGIIE